MADWALPKLSDPYANFMDSLKARDFDAISLGLNVITNPQTGMMRYVRASNLFQEYDGANWNNKIISVAGGGTGSATPGGAIGNLGLGTMALQNANNVTITGGIAQNLNFLHCTGTTQLLGAVGAGSLNVTANVQVGTDLAVSGGTFLNGLVTLYGSLTLNGDATVGRDLYVNRNAAVTGTLTANNLNANLNVQAGQDIIATRNLGVNGQASINGVLGAGSISTGGTIYAAGLIHGANDSIADRDVVGSRDVIAGVYIRARYAILSGPADKQITNPADGTILSSAIGYSWTGTGTRVLLDDNQWHDANTIGGGVREVVHNNFSFGTDEAIKDVVVSWAGAQPAGPKNWNLVFDQPYSDNASGNGGTVFYAVTYLSGNVARITRTLGPGAVPPLGPTGVVYTAFHHRTEV